MGERHRADRRVAPLPPARRRGGHIEAESIWIHLDRDLRPLRLDDGFLEIYGESAAGRRASTRLTLPRRRSRRHASGRCA